MNIIQETDNRINLLCEIYEKYSYNNIIKRFEGYDHPWYFVPPELVINTYNKGSIEIFDITTVDLDYDWDNWVSCNSISRILSKCCNLTPQEYFDICVLHINEIENRPKCKYCGSDLRWSGRLTAGYGSGGHLWSESNNHFCCSEHIVLYRNSHLDEYPDYREFIQSGGSFGLQYRNPDQYDPVGTSVYSTHIETLRSKFKNAGDKYDECYFYITRAGDKLKFDITQDADIRFGFGASFDNYSSDIRIIYVENRYFIADLEAEIKLRLGNSTEYLEWKDALKLCKYFGEVLSELKCIDYSKIDY